MDTLRKQSILSEDKQKKCLLCSQVYLSFSSDFGRSGSFILKHLTLFLDPELFSEQV